MRFLLNAATALSLILCAATLLLWPWSYYESHCLRYAPRRDGFGIGAYAVPSLLLGSWNFTGGAKG